MKTVFKYKSSDLSEEHIKQICRFSDRLYVKGEYQRMQGYIQFKIWHKRQMDKRDALIKLNCKKLII
jgi:hypothetical protein